MPHQTQALLTEEFSWLLHFYSPFGQEIRCTASLHCLLSYSNMQDTKLMWLIQYLLLLFTCDRKSKSHIGELNHLSCWCNAYLVIDLHKRDLSIKTQLWEKWWFYFLREKWFYFLREIILFSHFSDSQRSAISPLVPLCSYLTSPLQNQSLDSTSLFSASGFIFWLNSITI